MRRTYLDTGVLLAAFRGKQPGSQPALAILKEPDRIFLVSPFLEFELLPQAILHGHHEEQSFYQSYFGGAERVDDLDAIYRLAFEEASRSAVSGMDALHVAAAALLKADELITTERPGKGIYRNSLVEVIYWQD